METTPVVRVVDDRVFLRGLDALYRKAMRRHEAGELLVCARKLCDVLRIEPATGPVEGYYVEEPALTEYFQRVRALQAVGREKRDRVGTLQAFQRLEAVTSSPLFGKPAGGASLLPAGVDPLSTAMRLTAMEHWRVAGLVSAAQQIARSGDDFSLVGLAAFSGDAVLLAGLRETAVLYAELARGAPIKREQFTYEWRVDAELAARANRFVTTFHALFQEQLPGAEAGNAQQFWDAGSKSELEGRCVRIGVDDRVQGGLNYHWAICRDDDGRDRVHEFWSPELWTTDRFKKHLWAGSPLP